jgi:hypothetical protein
MVLDQRDVFRLRSLRSFSFGVRDALSFAQFLEAHTLKGRVVEEHILVRSDIDETETFVRQSLDRTLSHSSHFPNKKTLRRFPTTRPKQDSVARFHIVRLWTSESQYEVERLVRRSCWLRDLSRVADT